MPHADNRETDDPGQFEEKRPVSQTIGLYGLNFLFWYFPKAGGRIQPHKHPFEHGSILLRGTFRIEGDVEGRAGKDIIGIDVVRFPANSEHSILAKTDGAICLHVYPIHRLIIWVLKRMEKRFGRAIPLQDFHGGA